MPIAKQNHQSFFDSFRIRFYTIPNQSCRYSHHDVKRTTGAKNPIRWIKPRFYQAWVPSKNAERVTIPEKITDDEVTTTVRIFIYSIHFDNFQFCPKLNKNFRPIQQINKSVYKSKKKVSFVQILK
jgi:hypothetical protein